MTRTCIVLLVVAFVATTAATADELRVPKDYGTLQLAIDAARSGDVIVVRGGTHPGLPKIDGKTDLTIKGEKSPIVSDFDFLQSRRIRIQGFVVEGSTGGAAIYLWQSHDITIRKCVIRDLAGVGVLADNATGLVVEKCRIEHTGGDGIALGLDGWGVAHGCRIRKNDLTDIGGHGISIHNGNDNLVEKNDVADCSGWGVAITGTSARNRVMKNDVAQGESGFLCGAGNENTFEKNGTVNVARAFVLTRGIGNSFYKNSATDADIGFEVVTSSGPGENRLERNKVTRARECGVLLRMPDVEETETHRETVDVNVTASDSVRVFDDTSLRTRFADAAVPLPRFSASGILQRVTLGVDTNLAIQSLVQHSTSATATVYWYGTVDADADSLHVDADHTLNRHAPAYTQLSESWDHDVLASASTDTTFDAFEGNGHVLVDLVGETNLCAWWNPVDHLLSAWSGTIEVSLTYDYVPFPTGTLAVVRNKVKDAEADGFVVDTCGATLDGNKAKGSGECGFRADCTGNTFQGNKASRSGSFDLEDSAGGNVYDSNKFATESK